MASVSPRYARAFADVVAARNLDPQQIRHELRALLEVFQSSVELRRVWDNPAIPNEQKIGVLNALRQRLGFSIEVRNFAAVLIEHRRIGLLEEITRLFEHELNRRLGIAEAEITSARELGAEERSALESQIARLTGKKVSARYHTDRNLLGGAVVRLGSTIYDGSIRGQLDRIRENLVAG